MPAIRSSKLLKEQAPSLQPSIHSINVEELKKVKKPKKYKSEYWYDKLVYWLLISLTGSLIFGLLALINNQFIYIAPIFPVVGVISWLVRRIMKEKGIDKAYDHH